MEAGTGPLTRPDCQLSPWGGRCPCPGSCPLAGGSPLWDAFDPGQWQLQRPFVTDLSARKSPRTHGGRDPAPRVRTRTEIISGIRMEMIPSEESGLRASCPRDTGGSTGGAAHPGAGPQLGNWHQLCGEQQTHQYSPSPHPAALPGVGCWMFLRCRPFPSSGAGWERGEEPERCCGAGTAQHSPAQPGTAPVEPGTAAAEHEAGLAVPQG